MIVTPISTAITANASRNTVRNCSGDVAAACMAATWSAPRTTSASPSAARSEATTASASAARSAATSTSTSVGAATSSQGSSAGDATRTVRWSGAVSAPAKVAIPTTVASCIPVAVSTSTRSSRSTPAARARPRSRAISPRATGGRPASRTNGFSVGCSTQFRPTSVAVPVPTDAPSTTSLAKPIHWGATPATPSTAAARSTTSAGIERRTEPPSSPGPPSDSPRATPCTTASVAANARATSSAARPRIESDSTSVAVRNATDSMIASPVSTNRPRPAMAVRTACATIALIAPAPSSRGARHRRWARRSRRGRARPRRTPRDRPTRRRSDRA